MMSFWLAVILKIYPPGWRERYEDEFRAMLELCDLSLADWLDMGFSALETRTGYTGRNIMQDLLNRLTGLIALISALGFASVLVIPIEETAEFMLMASPFLSILLIPAFHRILKLHRPKTSLVVMMIGIIAVGLLPVNLVIGMFFRGHIVVIWISTLSFILIGMWLIAVNVLASITTTLPGILAFIGAIAGISWIITMTTTMVTSFSDFVLVGNQPFYSVYMTALYALLIGYFLWAVSTGLYFISGAVSRKVRLAY